MISFFSKKRNHQYIKCATTFIAAAIILLSIVTFNQGQNLLLHHRLAVLVWDYSDVKVS